MHDVMDLCSTLHVKFCATFQSEMPQISVFWHINFKIFLGGMPPDPPRRRACFACSECALRTTFTPTKSYTLHLQKFSGGGMSPRKRYYCMSEWPDQLTIACAAPEWVLELLEMVSTDGLKGTFLFDT